MATSCVVCSGAVWEFSPARIHRTLICIPGFALHTELALLVAAGLNPAEALRAATWNSAEFLGLTKDFGSIETGKIVDIVLLDANTIESIGNTRRIHAVVRRGRVTDETRLRAMLDGVRER